MKTCTVHNVPADLLTRLQVVKGADETDNAVVLRALEAGVLNLENRIRGGHARARSLSKARRKEIALKAIRTRWARAKATKE